MTPTLSSRLRGFLNYIFHMGVLLLLMIEVFVLVEILR